ncbi:MAG: efflux RND transporter periplasmic adaptor subunit [Bacteroidota bacterium]|nr:efflux RND transporter periplasmic adaptor subunit [Bacteroidota bacterium]
MSLRNTICRALVNLVLPVLAVSCQSPTKSGQYSEMEKTTYRHKTPEVKTIIVQPDVFYQQVVSNGVLSPVQKAKLIFKVNENIQQVNVKNGQWVQKGQVLARLDDFNQQLQLEKAKNNLLKAEIELKDILYAHSPETADTAEINPEVLKTARGRSGYNDARFALREAEYNLQHTALKAPFDGVIADIQLKENNYSAKSDYFAVLMDTRQMEVHFGMLETELDMIAVGTAVEVTPYAFPGKKFTGSIHEINPSVDENGMIMVKALVQNPEGVLLDGMNADVIVKNKIPGQLVIPKEALLDRQGRQMVFTLKNDSIAQWVYVKTGLENLSQVTIMDGLSNGDTIIVTNNFNLGHDVIVKAEMIEN